MTELNYHMLTALRYANINSDDKKTPVGVVIARGYKHVAFGTNKAVLPIDDFWSAEKYPKMVHAEVVAITNFLLLPRPVEPLKNLQMWVTLEVCSECAKFIIYTRRYTNIDKVYVWQRRPEGSGIHLLLEAGIQVEFITGELPE